MRVRWLRKAKDLAEKKLICSSAYPLWSIAFALIALVERMDRILKYLGQEVEHDNDL